MKKPCLSSLLALVAALMPVSAQAGGSSGVLVDSTLSFALRIVASGPESERNDVSTNRFETTRFGAREALAMLEELSMTNGRVAGPTSTGFPRGARLVVTTGGLVLVVDREGNTLMNASSYLEVVLNRDRAVSAGSFNNNNGDRQATNLMLATLDYDFPGQNVAETVVTRVVAVSGDEGQGSGLVSERNSRRYNRFRDSTSESAAVSGRISGNGSSGSGRVVVDGTISLNGRQTQIDD
ncbi:MAG: hypothetical protein AAGI48_09435 [Verrucomicrobiota bacterium]